MSPRGPQAKGIEIIGVTTTACWAQAKEQEIRMGRKIRAAGRNGAGLVAPTHAEPVVALPLVVHLHHAHEIEVLDLPMRTCQWWVTTCTEPMTPRRELALARGTPGHPHTTLQNPPPSTVGNALSVLGTNSFSLTPSGDRGLGK